MAIEDQLVGAALDALGWSAGARAAERAREMAYYSEGYKKLQEGVPLKEAGIDPTRIERTLGPDYAAHLVGYEKGEAFKQAAQQRQTMDFIRQEIGSFLTAPEMQAQTVEGVTPGEAEGFYPRLEGPGISDAAQVATANLTQQRPGFGALTQRLTQLPASLEELYFGTAGETTARGQLEEVAKPGVEQAETGLGLAARQQGLAEQEFQAKRVETVRGRRERRAGDVAEAVKTAVVSDPTLTKSQALKVARVWAGAAPERTLGDLADRPGIGRPMAGNIKPSQTFARLNEVYENSSKFVAAKQGKKETASYTQEFLDGLNDGDLRDAVAGEIEDQIARTARVDPRTLMDNITKRMRFRKRVGSKLQLVSLGDLPELEQKDQLTKILFMLQQAGGGFNPNVSPEANAWLQRGTTGGQAAPAPTAQLLGEAGQPVPYTGPMTQAGAQPGATAPPAPVQTPGNLPPPVVPQPPPSAIEARRRREALPRR